ncbi:MAG: LysM peptidoglycan-binding domain-containing protein [Candidatus Omnitrophota bacterium]
MKRLFYLISGIGIALYLTGCSGPTVRHSVDRVPRVDQEVAGNRGFIEGEASSAPKEPTFTDRKIYRTEVELPDLLPQKQKAGAGSETTSGTSLEGSSGDSEESSVSITMPVSAAQSTYTVQKNDTLQKISQKFFGTTKKWKLIYEANADKLKSPDKLFPGQKLLIPGVAEYKK